jgi:copper chaperone
MNVFRIPDMHCDGCVRSLTGAVRRVDATATLEPDMSTKTVRANSDAAPDALAEATRDAGEMA